MLAPEVGEVGFERWRVPQELAVAGRQGLEVVRLALDVERPQPLLGLGRQGWIGVGDRDERGGLRASVATAQVGERAVVHDGRRDELAELASELLGPFDLRFSQRAPRLSVPHGRHQRFEAADAGRAERRDHVEGGFEVGEGAGLEDQLVLQLLPDELQLVVGLGEQRHGVAAGTRLVLDQLHQRPELPHLRPAEVDVEWAQRRL
ncbi:MAG: hypothetical protein O3A02_02600 [bacterium]|nr:hypothetical protein [bacterium]